jgi:Mrp family chromosome partitioning ATPase
MAESPPRDGAPPKAGDEAKKASKTEGASEPAPNAQQKLRTTAMGLAPAPHLGGLSGSPGARARAEAEARKKRVQGRVSTRPPAEEPAAEPVKEERIEPLPAPFTGRPAVLFEGATPTTETEVAWAPPRYGSTTVLMVGNPLSQAAPQEPAISAPQELPRPYVNFAAHDAEPTIMMEPRPQPRPQQQAPYSAQSPHAAHSAQSPHSAHAAHSPPHAAHAAHAGQVWQGPPKVEPAPNTERMIRNAVPTPGTAMVPVSRAVTPPTTALALRPYEPPRQPLALTVSHDERVILLNEPDSARAASFRTLRDGLLGKNMPRVVAISSPVPHDGKTTCAINLALALAEQANTQVLLVDGNYFDPELAQIFKLDRLNPLTAPDPGLNPYKIAALTSSLHLAGIVRADGAREHRFEQQKFEALLDRLVRVNYDYIIIDTPALRGTPAVTQLLTTADATLLAVRSGGTTTRDLRRAADQIPKNKALGITLMDARPQR